jgi:hypothetical protein
VEVAVVPTIRSLVRFEALLALLVWLPEMILMPSVRRFAGADSLKFIRYFTTADWLVICGLLWIWYKDGT